MVEKAFLCGDLLRKISENNTELIRDIGFHKGFRMEINKRVLEKIRESYDSSNVQAAIIKYDEIRDHVESDADMRNLLREDLFRLHSGIAYLMGNYHFDKPEENLGELALDIDDRMFDIIESAEKVRELIQPLLALNIENGEESESDLNGLEMDSVKITSGHSE